jgi:hypothetical protein
MSGTLKSAIVTGPRTAEQCLRPEGVGATRERPVSAAAARMH